MGYGGLIGAGLRIVGGIGGSILAGSAARVRRNQLTNIANTPGLDTSSITGEALAGQEANFGAGSALTSKINRFNTQERQAFLDEAIPGYQKRKQAELDITDSYLRGEIPQDVQDQLQNSNAGRAVAGGYGGSGFAAHRTARDFGLTSLGLVNMGLDRTSSINRETASLEGPNLVSVANYLGVSPQELVAIRGGERAQKMAMLSSISKMPGTSDIWAKYLNDLGGATTGAAASGAFGGFGGGGLTDAQIGAI